MWKKSVILGLSDLSLCLNLSYSLPSIKGFIRVVLGGSRFSKSLKKDSLVYLL